MHIKRILISLRNKICHVQSWEKNYKIIIVGTRGSSLMELSGIQWNQVEFNEIQCN